MPKAKWIDGWNVVTPQQVTFECYGPYWNVWTFGAQFPADGVQIFILHLGPITLMWEKA